MVSWRPSAPTLATDRSRLRREVVDLAAVVHANDDLLKRVKGRDGVPKGRVMKPHILPFSESASAAWITPLVRGNFGLGAP